MKAHSRPARIRPALVCTLGLSLLLNAVLAFWLFMPNPDSPYAAVARAALARWDGVRSYGSGITDAALNAAAAAPAISHTPSFHWREIESDDNAQYIRNLRSIGCPELLIRDLIAARLNQYYTPKADAMAGVKVYEYWQKEERLELTAEQRQQDRLLFEEKARKFEELLGSPHSRQNHRDLVFLEIAAGERELLFISEDKREAALALLEKSGHREKEQKFQFGERGLTNEEEESLFNAKLQLLAGILSPAELTEFRLRRSPAAQRLRTEIQYFDCTPEEFSRLLDARDQAGFNSKAIDSLNRAPATELVRQLLGDERAKEFDKNTDPLFYQEARRRLEEAGLSAETANDVWQVSRDARTKAESLAGNTSLSVAQRQQQIQRLSDQFQQTLIDLMGEPASESVRRNLAAVLSLTERGIKP